MAKTEPTSTLTVVAKQPSRMRAGMAFTAEPRLVEVTEAQAKAIAEDPLLAIVPTKDRPDKDKKDKSQAPS